ncbi:MAG: FAD binding domain-containing protein, partial [Burkholderiales bacterium]
MMPLRKFTIHQPKTIAEASQMLAEFGDKGRLYAGGTELLLLMKARLVHLADVIDLKKIPDLGGITAEGDA